VAILTGFCPFVLFSDLFYDVAVHQTNPEYMTSLFVHLFCVNNSFPVYNVTFICSVDLFFYPHYKLLYLSFGLP